VELASSEETVTGTDSIRAVTPAGVQAAISNYLSLPRNFISGLLISNASDADHDITISDTTGAYPYIYATEMNSSKEILCGSVSAGSAYANGYLFTDTSGQLSLTWGGNSNRRNYLYTTGFRDYR